MAAGKSLLMVNTAIVKVLFQWLEFVDDLQRKRIAQKLCVEKVMFHFPNELQAEYIMLLLEIFDTYKSHIIYIYIYKYI